MARPTNDILGGTLDLLILKALSWGSAHGYGVAKWIEFATNDVLAVGEGTLYPALHRLEERALIVAEWGVSENNRRAKFYTLTAAGRRQAAGGRGELEALRGCRAGGAVGARATVGGGRGGARPLARFPSSVRRGSAARGG